MTHFDQMVAAVERFEPDLTTALKTAALIRMPAYDVTKASKRLDTEFRLPWNCVVMEDNESAVLLRRDGRMVEDKSANGWRHDGSTRFGTKDIGLEVGDLFIVGATDHRETHKGRGRVIFIQIWVQGIVTGEFNKVNWWCHRACVCDLDANKKMVFEHGEPAFEAITKQWLPQQVVVAMNQCVIATSPSNWIVRHVPSNKQQRLIDKRAVGPRIQREHERDHWLLITDAERRRYFRTNRGPGDREVAPHPRRGHYRHIGENEDGTRRHTWVRSCWVGSTEAEIRGGRYRVEIDL